VAAAKINGVFKHGEVVGPAVDMRSIVLVRAAGGRRPPPGPETITSETVVTDPAPRTRTTVGVGEEVDMTHAPGTATWAMTAGTLSATTGVTVRLTAPTPPSARYRDRRRGADRVQRAGPHVRGDGSGAGHGRQAYP
jgi:hypothetical protein